MTRPRLPIQWTWVPYWPHLAGLCPHFWEGIYVRGVGRLDVYYGDEHYLVRSGPHPIKDTLITHNSHLPRFAALPDELWVHATTSINRLYMERHRQGKPW